jgi:hypothetical protein
MIPQRRSPISEAQDGPADTPLKSKAVTRVSDPVAMGRIVCRNEAGHENEKGRDP